jgi:hypothetical protein
MKSFKEFFEEKYKEPDYSLVPDSPYEVIDMVSGKVVWSGLYKDREVALRIAKAHNRKHGKMRFMARSTPILEYRHKDAFGGIKQSVHSGNKKGDNITRDPLTRKIPWNKGPYQKIRKDGEILIGNDLLKELGDLNGVEFKNGKEIKRKNSNQILKLFTNAYGQPCGKIVEIKESVEVKSVVLTREIADKIATNLIEAGITRKCTIRMTAEIIGVPESAVRAVKAYLLRDIKHHSDPEGAMLRNADMILKGWDDDKVGVGQLFKGIVPDDMAQGEAIYQQRK